MRIFTGALVALTLGAPASALCEVGTYYAGGSVTEARIAGLPGSEQQAWTAYLQRSRALMAQDKAQLAAERGAGPTPPMTPKGPSGGGGMPLDREPAWYATPEARRMADNIVSFQTPAGGWGKNQDRTGPQRLRGQAWTAVDVPWAARDIAGDPDWAFVGTIDNNATTQEMRFLARVQRQLTGAEGQPYRAAFLKGVRYLLTAQYPNGGWPQAFPLMGGYHDAITFNDNATPKVLDLLTTVAARQDDYAFVPAALADEARRAAAKGFGLVLRTQVQVDGRPTIWGQQHDPFTLAPTGARAWEPPALSAEESSGVLIALMHAPHPSPELSAAVESGVAWLSEHALYDVEWPSEKPAEGRLLAAKPGAGPIWARLYDLKTGKPTFGARDQSVHDHVEDLPPDLRNSYSWFGTAPKKALAAHARWLSAQKR
jgi:PelA/Pel-15E family pectate lyase